MAHAAAKEGGYIRELTETEAWELFHEAAEYYLGMSGEEFIESWESGQFDNVDQPDVMSVVMLLPFARPE